MTKSTLRSKTSNMIQSMRNLVVPSEDILDTPTLISKLLDMGGWISGGAAAAWLYGGQTKDIDFYFNDPTKYIEACNISHNNPRIDICWYFDNPYELHDIDLVQIAISSNRIVQTDESKLAWDTKVSHILGDRVIYPVRTAQRIVKYNRRYGITYPISEIIAFCMVHGLSNILESMCAFSYEYTIQVNHSDRSHTIS